MALLVALLASAACDDVRAGHPASDQEREAARAMIAQLVVLTQHPDASAGILDATDAAPLLALIAPQRLALPPRPDFSPDIDALSDCFIATATSATLSQCEFAEHVVDGTWVREGRRTHTEMVDVFVVDPQTHGSVAIEANLAVGNDLSGALDANIMWSSSSGEFVLDVSLRADGLLVESPDCASGGTVTISATQASVLPDGEGTSQTTTTSLWFGPGCQDVHIAR